MGFPQTRLTLIRRLAEGGSSADWQNFMRDYWRPVCRFAKSRAPISWTDAEDVTAQVFQILWESGLLGRWSNNPTARLRTMLCSVARNVLSNDARVRLGRQRLLREHGPSVVNSPGSPLISSDAEDDDESRLFYAAWVQELLQRAIDELLVEFQSQHRLNEFRTLFGRLCDGMSLPEIATALDEELTAIERYNRHSRERLREKLQSLVRQHVESYAEAEQLDAEFRSEWQLLGAYLQEFGGLEGAVQLAYERIDQPTRSARQADVMKGLPKNSAR